MRAELPIVHNSIEAASHMTNFHHHVKLSWRELRGTLELSSVVDVVPPIEPIMPETKLETAVYAATPSLAALAAHHLRLLRLRVPFPRGGAGAGGAACRCRPGRATRDSSIPSPHKSWEVRHREAYQSPSHGKKRMNSHRRSTVHASLFQLDSPSLNFDSACSDHCTNKGGSE